jgi:uncharacterized membrane protein
MESINMMKAPRLRFLDFARGMAIVFMILQHSVVMYEAGGGKYSITEQIIYFLGTAPAAPVFLLIMGIFYMRPNRAGLRYGIIRGLKLIALGYVLNLFRFCLPAMILEKFGKLFEGSHTPLSLLLVVDLLHAAGLSLILMAFIRQYIRKPFIWLLLAAMTLFVSPLLWGTFDGCYVFSLFWGTGETVVFPLFPWLAYPLVGMFYGCYLLGQGSQKLLMKRSALAGLLLLLGGAAMWIFSDNALFGVGDYARSGPPVHFAMFGFVFMWLSLCRWLIDQIPNNPLLKLLFFWSGNVTSVYFIQWILFGWGLFLFPEHRYMSAGAVLVGIAAIGVTHAITLIYLKLKKHILGYS